MILVTFLPLTNLLNTETNEQIYESAIKSLGQIGGERAAAALESIWFAPNETRGRKSAARKVLKTMDLWSGDSPLFNEESLRKSFCLLRTKDENRDSKRGRAREELLDEVAGEARAGLLNAGYSLDQVSASNGRIEVDGYRLSWSVTRLQQQWYFRVHYEAVVTDIDLLKLVPWTPSSADAIEVTLADTFDIKRALKRAQEHEMTIELILDDRIRVSGKKWPGFSSKEYWSGLRLDISINELQTEIVVHHVPYGADWNDCLRLLVRLTRWLAH